jgi:hypothetical protein
MNRYKIIYKRPDYDRNMSLVIEANNEEEVEQKFKMDIFKNFKLVSITLMEF